MGVPGSAQLPDLGYELKIWNILSYEELVN